MLQQCEWIHKAQGHKHEQKTLSTVNIRMFRYLSAVPRALGLGRTYVASSGNAGERSFPISTFISHFLSKWIIVWENRTWSTQIVKAYLKLQICAAPLHIWNWIYILPPMELSLGAVGVGIQHREVSAVRQWRSEANRRWLCALLPVRGCISRVKLSMSNDRVAVKVLVRHIPNKKVWWEKHFFMVMWMGWAIEKEFVADFIHYWIKSQGDLPIRTRMALWVRCLVPRLSFTKFTVWEVCHGWLLTAVLPVLRKISS